MAEKLSRTNLGADTFDDLTLWVSMVCLGREWLYVGKAYQVSFTARTEDFSAEQALRAVLDEYNQILAACESV